MSSSVLIVILNSHYVSFVIYKLIGVFPSDHWIHVHTLVGVITRNGNHPTKH